VDAHHKQQYVAKLQVLTNGAPTLITNIGIEVDFSIVLLDNIMQHLLVLLQLVLS